MDDTALAGARRHARAGAVITFAALAVAFGYCYYDVVGLLVFQWWTKDFYSYGFLIPAISGYLAWSRRDRIREAFGAPSYVAGVVVLGSALFVLQLGRAASFALLEEVSLPVAIAGVILLVGGRRALQATWLPVAYLYFAVPIWDVLTDNLQYTFQLMSAVMGERLMGLAGVPALRVGTLLYLPNISLEVAAACSGVSYLVSVIAIAVPYSYLMLSSNLRRIAAGAFAVVVAILSNGVRVALIGVLQYYRLAGPQDLHGPAHTLQGMFVAVIGYLALFGGVRLLEDKARAPRQVSTPKPWTWRAAPLALGVALALLAASGLLRLHAEPTARSVADGDPFPPIVGRWLVQPEGVVGGSISWPGADQSIQKVYAAQGIGTVRLYVGYQARQAPGRKLVGDGQLKLSSPTGWVRLRTPDGAEVRAAESNLVNGSMTGGRTTILYWYDLQGQIATNPYWVKLLTVWNSLVHRDSGGAVVVFVLRPAADANPQAALEALGEFAAAMAPHTREYLSPALVGR